MNNTNLTPRPTEYKGIRFRSKSEAIFARTLDLVVPQFHQWEYEPNQNSNGKHSHDWDFEIGDDRCPCCPYRIILIEYKPSKPSDTYVKTLTEKIRESTLKRNQLENNLGRRTKVCFDSFIAWGNPFSGPPLFDEYSVNGSCSYVFMPLFANFWQHHDFDVHRESSSSECSARLVLGITEPVVQEAMKYRFDLQ